MNSLTPTFIDGELHNVSSVKYIMMQGNSEGYIICHPVEHDLPKFQVWVFCAFVSNVTILYHYQRNHAMNDIWGFNMVTNDYDANQCNMLFS